MKLFKRNDDSVNYEEMISEYDTLKKLKKTKQRLYKVELIFTIIVLVLFVVFIAAGIYICDRAVTRDNTIIKLEKEIDNLNDYIDDLENIGGDVNTLTGERDSLNNEISEKKSELDSINKSIEEKQKLLENVSYDADLVTKYDYVLYDTENKRNDMDLDLIKLAVNECDTMDINPDLVFGIIKVESEGHAGVTNSYSGAAGLGQFMHETGDFIATNYLNIDYDHSSTPYDGSTNIKMMVQYLAYLYDKYNGDTISVIKEYSGGDLQYAYNYYSKVLNAVGHDIA